MIYQCNMEISKIQANSAGSNYDKAIFWLKSWAHSSISVLNLVFETQLWCIVTATRFQTRAACSQELSHSDTSYEGPHLKSWQFQQLTYQHHTSSLQTCCKQEALSKFWMFSRLRLTFRWFCRVCIGHCPTPDMSHTCCISQLFNGVSKSVIFFFSLLLVLTEDSHSTPTAQKHHLQSNELSCIQT